MVIAGKMQQHGLLAAVLFLVGACDGTPLETRSGLQADSLSSLQASRSATAAFTPVGVDATGRKDVTKELNDFITSVPDGSTIRFPAGAKYRIDYTLWIKDRKNLTIDGNGALFFTTIPGPYGYVSGWVLDRRNRTRYHWAINNSSGIKIRNVKVRGANPYAGLADLAYYPQFEAQHGFSVGSSSDVLIENVTVTDVWGDFVYLGGGSGFTRNVVIRNNHFERNGRQGIGITAAENVLIEKNYIGQTRRATIDLEPNSKHGGAKRITIRNNTFGPGRLVWIAAGNALGTISDITAENNRLLDGRSMTVQIRARTGRRERIRVVGNTSEELSGGSGEGMLYFLNVDGVEVRDNRARLDPRRAMTAVAAIGSCDVVVQGNSFSGAKREALVRPSSACSN